jgi:beta-lactamase class A
MRHRALIIISTFFFLTNILFAGLYFSGQNNKSRDAEVYPLLSKRIFLEDSSDVLVNFQPLREDIRGYLDNTGVAHSFYFEYLFTGSTIRYGDDNKLVGASLMKIPIVMDLYKASELGKINLDQEITVRANDINADPQFGNQDGLKAGDVITLREAAKISLTESDNTASLIIFNSTQGLLEEADQSINNLDIETTVKDSDQGKFALISARSYSSFLKCLYFSCYLSTDHSQEILNELTLAKDVGAERIRAGVPSGVKVAQKFGSFSDITQSDCGIIYAENRRYALCVMLDTDANTANNHIKKLSEMVYSYVTRVNR